MDYINSQNRRIKLLQESFITGDGTSFERIMYRFKLIMVGNVSVGKTAILQQFMNKKFCDQYTCTINVDIKMQTLTLDDSNIVDLQIWDTCGQETYKHLTKQYYNNTNGCFLIFDLTNRSSFDDLPEWINDIRQNASKDIMIMLVGNKSDMIDKREIGFEEASEFAKQYGIDYIETSAKSGVNVRLLFDVCCLSLIKKSEEQDKSLSVNTSSAMRKLSVGEQNFLKNKSSRCAC
jgi:small GTP-binding protein